MSLVDEYETINPEEIKGDEYKYVEPVACYIAENVELKDDDINKIKEIISPKFSALEYFPLIKLAFLWTIEELSEEELGKLNILYGFIKPR